MTDLLAEKRARMACRVYLKLFDAGLGGTNITTADAIGPGESDATEFPVAVEVMRRFIDGMMFNEKGHGGGSPHYALTRPQQDHMESRPDPRGTIAERVRAAIATFDGGEVAADGDFTHLEALIRTGFEEADSL